MSKKTTREVQIGIDVAADDTPDTWRVSVECADELTSMTLIGAQWRGSPLLDVAELRGALGLALVEDHQDRCLACRRWAAGRPTVSAPRVAS
jgi:hypothetical protein